MYDRFHSALLGRPFAIADQDWDDRAPIGAGSTQSDRASIAMTHVSDILGDILRKVYRPRTISGEAATALANRLQEWRDSLPPDLNLHSLLRNSTGTRPQDRQVLQRMHTGYLHAVILLTRPFFLYVIASRIMKPTPRGAREVASNGTIARLANACVVSATRTIEIADVLFVEGARPIRAPFLVYFVFYAALILLLDVNCRNKSPSVNPAIAHAKSILASYGDVDPSSSRYIHVCEVLSAEIQHRAEVEQMGAADIANDWPIERQQPHVASSVPPAEFVTPDSNLSLFFSGDGQLDTSQGSGGDNLSFDFDPAAYWDSLLMQSEGNFCGMLLQPEF